MAKRPLTVLSVFSGLGGLDLGLECAGFRHVMCIERDPTARASLVSSRPSWPLAQEFDVSDAVRALKLRQLGVKKGELDLLAGGPPCQPFSKAAQWSARARSGLKDARSSCIHSFIDLIELCLPRAVLIENVPGFVSGRTDATVTLKSALAAINRRCNTDYCLSVRVIDASLYGVPQRRKRAILIAFRNGATPQWPRATHEDYPLTAWDALHDVDVIDKPSLTGRWADLLPSIPEGQNYLWHTPEGHGEPLFSYRSRYWSFLLKLSKRHPSWTLSASPGPATGPFHWSNRPLAREELLRLQSFPTTWHVLGSYRDQVRQIGNATPPLLAEMLGRTVRQGLTGRALRSPLKLEIPRGPKPPRASRTRPVPKQYLDLRAEHPAHPGTGKGPGAMHRVRLEGVAQ